MWSGSLRTGRFCKISMVDSAERFLLVRLTSLGDILHTMPAAAALRAAHPTARIDWVVERKWAPVLEGSPMLDEVIPFDPGPAWRVMQSVRRLRRANYTCAIDFQGLYKSALLAAFSKIPVRIGFASDWARERAASLCYTKRVVPVGRHVAELNYALAEAAGATRPATPTYPLRVPEEGAASIRARLAKLGIGKYVVVGPGAGWHAKRWPPERYGELCRELGARQEQGIQTIVLQGPGEKALAQTVCRAAAPAKPTVMTTTLPELMALLAGAQCVICSDSGPLHLATALGTPVVGLYGPTDPKRNGPFGPRVVIETQARPDEISYKRRNTCAPAMLRISVEHVLAGYERSIGLSARAD